MLVDIENTYAKDNYISSGAMGIWIGYANIRGDYIKSIYTKDAFIKDIQPKILARSRIILGISRITFTDVGVNNYYF